MNYCPQCGRLLSLAVPVGDTLPRHVCGHCGAIHYQNPKVVAGCIPEWEGRILLCKRGIDPKYGFWTFPAGFMELDESTEQAAVRETLEEARTEVDITSLYAVFSLVQVNQVYVIYRGRMRSEAFGVGHESLEAELVHPDRIRWETLAFPVIEEALRRYVRDLAQGQFGVHFGVVTRRVE